VSVVVLYLSILAAVNYSSSYGELKNKNEKEKETALHKNGDDLEKLTTLNLPCRHIKLFIATVEIDVLVLGLAVNFCGRYES